MDWLNNLVDFARTTPTFPTDFTAWDFLNSNLLLALVGAAFTLVFREEAERQRKNEDINLQNEVQKSVEETEKQEAHIASTDDKPNLKATGEIIRRLKDAIELRTKEDKRFKKTYDKIARYDYVPLIEAMETRNLKDGSAILLKEAFNLFKPYRNGRNEVPLDVVNRLREIFAYLQEMKFVMKAAQAKAA